MSDDLDELLSSLDEVLGSGPPPSLPPSGGGAGGAADADASLSLSIPGDDLDFAELDALLAEADESMSAPSPARAARPAGGGEDGTVGGGGGDAPAVDTSPEALAEAEEEARAALGASTREELAAPSVSASRLRERCRVFVFADAPAAGVASSAYRVESSPSTSSELMLNALARRSSRSASPPGSPPPQPSPSPPPLCPATSSASSSSSSPSSSSAALAPPPLSAGASSVRLPAFSDELRPDAWRVLLGCHNQDETKMDGWDRELNLPNQKVIRMDCDRTRPGDAEFERAAGEKRLEALEQLLTFYCKSRGVSYKQGLNEIAAPFVAVFREERFSEAAAYNCFYALVSKFLPSIFDDREFESLQCIMRLFNLLLLYHDPQLCNFLNQYHILPELYATPWFITLFARKAPMPVVCALWDAYIVEDDPFLHYFVALALLISNRSRLLRVEQHSLPQTLAALRLRSVASVRELVFRAKRFRARTPVSFRQRLFKICFAVKDPVRVRTVSANYGRLPCMSMPAAEIVRQCYHDVLEDGAIKYMILDVRPRDEFEAGRLPCALHLDPALLDAPDQLQEVLAGLSGMKGCHFCIMDGGGDPADDGDFCDDDDDDEHTRAASASAGGGGGSGDEGSGEAAAGGEAKDGCEAPGAPGQDSSAGRGAPPAPAYLFLVHFLQRGFPHMSRCRGGYDSCFRIVVQEGTDLVVGPATGLGSGPVPAHDAAAPAQGLSLSPFKRQVAGAASTLFSRGLRGLRQLAGSVRAPAGAAGESRAAEGKADTGGAGEGGSPSLSSSASASAAAAAAAAAATAAAEESAATQAKDEAGKMEDEAADTVSAGVPPLGGDGGGGGAQGGGSAPSRASRWAGALGARLKGAMMGVGVPAAAKKHRRNRSATESGAEVDVSAWREDPSMQFFRCTLTRVERRKGKERRQLRLPDDCGRVLVLAPGYVIELQPVVVVVASGGVDDGGGDSGPERGFLKDKHAIADLVRITSRKSVPNALIFHWGSRSGGGGRAVDVRCYELDNRDACIEAVRAHYAAHHREQEVRASNAAGAAGDSGDGGADKEQ